MGLGEASAVERSKEPSVCTTQKGKRAHPQILSLWFEVAGRERLSLCGPEVYL